MSDQVKITVLVDNQAGEGLAAEHGLSLWIEAKTTRILFDTGQGGALAANARNLGISLDQTDVLILSHGHFDHTGGIPHVLEHAGEIEVYSHPAVIQPRYSIHARTPRPIQMPSEARTALNRLPSERVHWIREATTLVPGIELTGPIPRDTRYEDPGGPFFLDPEGAHPDSIEDDMALWIDTPAGLIVCVGCCHAGLVNTLNHVTRLSDTKRIRAIIGGLHLLNASDERLDRTIATLRFLAPDRIIPCHCTGDHAVQALAAALGDRVSMCRSGMAYHFA
jgi:7,8-dihydropterin-6-yl-methyl-4-(beta-D-ribofuranosyl)aminobenzene 5'-phosphate synthase